MFSVGHGAAAQQELAERLRRVGITRLVDVRTAPGSRRHPQFNSEQLAAWLPQVGVTYRWEPRLGGFRKPAPESPDTFWTNDSFRGYAAHLRSDEAKVALALLAVEADAGPLAFMCSETLWWRCHRRLVSDALVLLHGRRVEHLLPGGNQPHPVSAGARVVGDGIVYDVVAPPKS